nr:hypothetical protein SHINE37_44623 [Rhizobiaceae bacterium]
MVQTLRVHSIKLVNPMALTRV